MANKKKSPKVSVADTPHSPDGSSVERVPYYDNFMEKHRTNHVVEGFWFDQDTFENTVAKWADPDQIPIILKTPEPDLDIFCKALYNQNFRDAVNRMNAINVMYARGVLLRLFENGNSSAVSIAKSVFAKFLDSDPNSHSFIINIKNDLDS